MADPATRMTPGTSERMEVEAHDNEQLALHVRHERGSANTGGIHELEVYLFIPRNVGLNATNYPSSEFYSDLTTYLRLDLPELELEDLRTNARSPLRRVDHHLAQLAVGDATPEPIGIAVKLFGHEFTEATRAQHAELLASLRAGVEQTRSLPASPQGPQPQWRVNLLRDLVSFAAGARSALNRLRATKRKFSPYRRVAPQVWEVLQQTDEYTSLFLDGILAELADELRHHRELFDGSGWCGHVLGVLSSCAASEATYRHEQGFVNFEPSRAGNREYFLYRRSLLKKAVQQALWVDTRRRQNDQYVRNAAGMVAAGIAATWALIAQLPQRITMMPPALQAAMIALPVIAYVAKDRIKELAKEWLIRRLRSFDQETSLGSSLLARAGLGSLSGTLSEKVRFIESEAVPPEVLAVRRRSRWIAGAQLGGESVLVYRRRLEVVAPEAVPTTEGEQFALRQIIRLNLRHFMTRLDERDQTVRHFEPVFGTFATRQIAKVYHVNVIVRLVSWKSAPHLQRWRVILSKDGIERIEAAT